MAKPIQFLIPLVLLGVGSDLFGSMSKARRALAERKLSKAAVLFYQESKSGKRHKRIQAQLGLADTLYRMRLFYSASMYYSNLVRAGYKGNKSYFRKGLAKLGTIDTEFNLGQSHVVQLLKLKINSSQVPPPAKGFYFYYKGVEAFTRRGFKSAGQMFKRVSASSPYYTKAQFHLGVIATISGKRGKGIEYFEKVKRLANGAANEVWLTQQANLNIARTYYEAKQFKKAITYYARIPRESDNWLQALFEASWAFFMMEKANNTLGNIHTLHSPFFENRFFPESYILQAVTFLRLCRYERVRESVALFKKRYDPVTKDVRLLLERYNDRKRDFFDVVLKYRTGELRQFRRAWAILDALARTDTFKQALLTVRNSNDELEKLDSAPRSWRNAGLLGDLRDFLRKKKAAATADTGVRMFRQGTDFYRYLVDLSEQTRLITAELLLGKVDSLRQKLNIHTEKRKANFIGGMKPLKVGEKLEYWPFEGEYWEDELGGYVFNIDSICKK